MSSSRRRLPCLVALALLCGCGTPEPHARRSLGGAGPSADFLEGQRLFRELRYREAELSLRLAHEAEPQNREVLDLLTKVELTCPIPRAAWPHRHGLSIELAKTKVRRLFDEGEALLDLGDTSLAITRLERALETIKWFPYQIDDEGLKERAEQLLATARAVQPTSTAPVRSASVRSPPAELPTQPDFVEGLRHYEAFDYRKAADCFLRASGAEPDDEVIRHYLLQSQLLCGDRVADFETLEERLTR